MSDRRLNHDKSGKTRSTHTHNTNSDSKIKIPEGFKQAIYISWEAWEPMLWSHSDGCSLHKTIEDAEKFIREVADRWEYPVGLPKPVFVSPELYEEIVKNNTVWVEPSREISLIKSGKLIHIYDERGMAPSTLESKQQEL